MSSPEICLSKSMADYRIQIVIEYSPSHLMYGHIRSSFRWWRIWRFTNYDSLSLSCDCDVENVENILNWKREEVWRKIRRFVDCVQLVGIVNDLHSVLRLWWMTSEWPRSLCKLRHADMTISHRAFKNSPPPFPEPHEIRTGHKSVFGSKCLDLFIDFQVNAMDLHRSGHVRAFSKHGWEKKIKLTKLIHIYIYG